MSTYAPHILEQARNHIAFLCRQAFRGAWPAQAPSSEHLLTLVDAATAQQIYDELRRDNSKGS